jgi:L-aspartate oxidase
MRWKGPHYCIDTDVLVIGAGAAGLRAALEAALQGVDVLLVCKGKLGRCGSTFHPSSPVRGIQAASGLADDSIEKHFQEILDIGLGVTDPGLAQVLAEEAPLRVKELQDWGIPFRCRDGQPIRFLGCFSTTPRAVVIDNLGGLADIMLDKVLRAGVKRYEHLQIVRLITKGARCCGALGIDTADRLVQIRSRACILAAGGGAGIFQNTLAPQDQIGDSYALAWQAGATLRDLEFFQIVIGVLQEDMLGFFPINLFFDYPIISSSRASDILAPYYSDQERLTAYQKRGTHIPFSTRDVSRWIDIAIARDVTYGPVWIDAGERRYQVVPCGHAFNGGIEITQRCETSIEGLYACGEAAGGMHGADRIGGNMMSATQVFGARAGRYAAMKINSTPLEKDKIQMDSFPLSDQGTEPQEIEALIREVRQIVSTHGFLIRSPTGLQEALERVERLTDELKQITVKDMGTLRRYLTLCNILTFAHLLLRAQYARKASLGAHYLEHPT